jgi:tetratricopeptide (TPR) repeat protein
VLKKYFEPTDPILIGPLDNLVEVCKSQGKGSEAAQYQKQIDQILAFGRAHIVARTDIPGLPLKQCPPSSALGLEAEFSSRGDVFKAKGDTKTAALYYQKAAAHNETQYLQKLADAELELKDYAKAEAAYKRLDAIDKKSQPEDEGKRMQDMFGLACSAAGLKKSREARPLFITIINSDSKLVVVLALQPKAHLEYARLLAADGEIDQAREEYKKIIANGNGYYMDYRKGAQEELAALH